MSNIQNSLSRLALLTLKKIIKRALYDFQIDASWQCPKTRSPEVLINFINDLCNEFALSVDENNVIFKL